MIRFKQYLNLINESRTSIDSLKTIYSKGINSSHDSLGEHKNSNSIIDHFASKGDPSKDKKYTHWIVSRYNKGQFRQEDHSRVHEALSNFEQHKNKLISKDINQYKHLTDVEDAVEPHIGSISNKQEKRQEKHEGADLIHSENGLTVHKLNTKEGACHYGAGTKWCTASRKNNMFDQYNKQGSLYVVNTPDKRKYQFHFETNQFMNEKDQPESLGHLVKKYPSLKNVSQFKNESHGYYFAKDSKERDHLLNKALDHKYRDIREAAIQHPNATKDHIDKALNDQDSDVRQAAVSHPNATKDHVDKGLNDKNSNVREAAIQHPNAAKEHIDKGLNDKNSNVRQAAVSHPNAPSDPSLRKISGNILQSFVE